MYYQENPVRRLYESPGVSCKETIPSPPTPKTGGISQERERAGCRSKVAQGEKAICPQSHQCTGTECGCGTEREKKEALKEKKQTAESKCNIIKGANT